MTFSPVFLVRARAAGIASAALLVAALGAGSAYRPSPSASREPGPPIPDWRPGAVPLLPYHVSLPDDPQLDPHAQTSEVLRERLTRPDTPAPTQPKGKPVRSRQTVGPDEPDAAPVKDPWAPPDLRATVPQSAWLTHAYLEHIDRQQAATLQPDAVEPLSIPLDGDDPFTAWNDPFRSPAEDPGGWSLSPQHPRTADAERDAAGIAVPSGVHPDRRPARESQAPSAGRLLPAPAMPGAPEIAPQPAYRLDRDW